MKLTIVQVIFFSLIALSAFAQKVTVQSPNQKISVALFSEQNIDAGEWYIKASYNNNGKVSEAIPRIDLGLSRSDQDFSKELKFLKAGKPPVINEQYTVLHGKKSVCSNSANEVIVSFENPSKAKLNIIIRAYNDGIAFLKNVPNAWDDTKLIDGYPGQDVIIARRKGTSWYIGGINAQQRERTKTIKFDFLPEGIKYKMTLIADGKFDTKFTTQYIVVDKSSSVDVRLLRRGGFAASLVPVE